MQAYKEWVRHNHLWVASMESIANTLTWFLPERFTNSEIGTEAVTSLIGLVTAVNQHIIETTPKVLLDIDDAVVTQGISLPTDKDRSFAWPLYLSVTKELEVLIEVAAEQYLSRDGKWTVLAAIETIKAVLRLIIFHGSGYNLLIDGGETPFTEEDPRSSYSGSFGFVANMDRNKIPSHIFPTSEDSSTSFQNVGKDSGRDMESLAMKALSRFGESVQAAGRPSWENSWKKPKGNPVLIDEVASTSESCRLTLLQTKGWPLHLFILGEVTSILRPSIFVLFIRRYGLSSWKPWVVSFTVDVTAMCILLTVRNIKRSLNYPHPNIQQNKLNNHISVIEIHELRRRQLVWALYLLRDPFFSKYTRQQLEKTECLLKPIPVFGMLAAKAVELIIGVQKRYSYTSAS